MFRPESMSESLSSIAEKEGFPESFTETWMLPPTAIYGYANDQSFVLPTPGSSSTGPTAPANAHSPAAAGQTVPKQ